MADDYAFPGEYALPGDYGGGNELQSYIDRERNNNLGGGGNLTNQLATLGNVGANIIGAVRGTPKKKPTTSLGPILLIGGAVVAVLLIVVLLVRR